MKFIHEKIKLNDSGWSETDAFALSEDKNIFNYYKTEAFVWGKKKIIYPKTYAFALSEGVSGV